jgi:hypothetical protein
LPPPLYAVMVRALKDFSLLGTVMGLWFVGFSVVIYAHRPVFVGFSVVIYAHRPVFVGFSVVIYAHRPVVCWIQCGNLCT